ncbi:MAG: hypothetical protein CSA62_13790 [Planctomycetota bacterium]|nr:MAG: hypothetical protein CSA62_13790 [Planctomycetota bacterium]
MFEFLSRSLAGPQCSILLALLSCSTGASSGTGGASASELAPDAELAQGQGQAQDVEAAAAPAPQPRQLPPPRLPFQALLWRHQGPQLDAAFAAAVHKSGLTGICIDQGEDPRKAQELGLRFYLDHAAGKGILHLREQAWRRIFERYEKSRSALDLQRPMPLSKASTLAELHRLVEERVSRAGPLAPLAISLDDEISTTRLANPLDFCFAPESLTAFRTWLQRRYGTLEKLEEYWGREIPSWSQLLPPTTDQVRMRELYQRRWPRNLCDWNDHRAFMDWQLASVLSRLCEQSRELAPGVPVGFEGGQAPSAFGGFDYARLLDQVDFIEPYDIGGTRMLVRSFAKRGTLHYETLFPANEKTPAQLSVAKLYEALAHGLNGVIVWSSGLFFGGENAARLSSYGQLLAAELPRVTSQRAAELAGAPLYPGSIAILESQESVRLHWMLDSAKDRSTWLRRFGSYEAKHSSSQAARLSWIRLLQDGGYAFRFVSPRQLIAGDFGKGPAPRVLILPSTLALSEAALRSITRFASLGGLVIADEVPGRYDESLRLRDLSPLDAFFGVVRNGARRYLREGRCLEHAPKAPSGLPLIETGLQPLGLTACERVGEDACHFERGFGEGKAVLLNVEVSRYWQLRLQEEKRGFVKARELRRRLRSLLEQHRVLPVALAQVEGYPTILQRQLLGEGRRKILVVRANCLENPALFQKLVEEGPRPMKLTLPIPAQVYDLWTGRRIGVGDQIQTSLDPLRGSFFVVEAL